MTGFFDALGATADGNGWLIMASLVLCTLFAVRMLRYHRLYLQTHRNEHNYATLIDNLSEGIYRSSPDGHQISANKALVKLNGYTSEPEMLASVKDIATEWYVDPTRRADFRELLQRDGRVEDFVSEIYRHKTRERIWISESARLVRDEKTGTPLFYEGSVREITDTVRRLAAEEQLQKLTSELPGGLFQFTLYNDGRSVVHYLSVGAELIHGVPSREITANPELFSQMVLAEDLEDYVRTLKEASERLDSWDHEFRMRARDGTEKWVHVLARPEPSPDGITWHGYIADISVRRKQELEIEELAFFDPLTRLPNRRMFLRRMSRSIADCAAQGGHGALLFIDLDNFKTLNDTQGHDVGDRYLSEVADRLRSCVGARDTVARIGGDEFVVILEQACRPYAEVTRSTIVVAGRILGTLRQVSTLGELHHAGSASIGIVVFDGSEPRVEQVLKRADIAMYQAKAAGRNGMALFDPATLEQEEERYRLLNELRLAFADNQLELHFQPQFDHERRITGAEALLRWRHPTRGIIRPDVIVPLAAQFGLIAELSSFVLERGLQTLAAWQRDERAAQLRLALNMNLQTIGSDRFIVTLAKRIMERGVDPRKLTFELVEDVSARDQHRIAARMGKLKELGIRLSLDDFGTGYSSLTFLKNLPFDEVKIDGSFVSDIEKGDRDRALVKTMLSMASNLGLTVAAEHVENERQEAYLRAFGCDFFQGYLYSEAMPENEFLAFLGGRKTTQFPGRFSSAR